MKYLVPCPLRRDLCPETPGSVHFYHSKDLSDLVILFSSSLVSWPQQEGEERGGCVEDVQEEESPERKMLT